MKRLLSIFVISVVALACGSNDKSQTVATTISGCLESDDVKSISLVRVSDDLQTTAIIATTAVGSGGAFSFELGIKADSAPRLYQLVYNSAQRPITLVVAEGDDIRVKASGDIFYNYSVEGSTESQLIAEFNHNYFKAVDAGIGYLDTNVEASLAEAQRAMAYQAQFVARNIDKLAAVYAVEQRSIEDMWPLLEGRGVGVAHRLSLIEGLGKSYANSPYIEALQQSVERAHLVSNVKEQSYPDIELTDMHRKSHRLSDTEGKVVLIYFWSANSALCNTIVAEIKGLYERYHDKGFEVYMVSADDNRSVWIEAVRSQGHPWISVFGGDNPTVFATYNIVGVPMAYIIDRSGELHSCNLERTALESTIKELL